MLDEMLTFDADETMGDLGMFADADLEDLDASLTVRPKPTFEMSLDA